MAKSSPPPRPFLWWSKEDNVGKCCCPTCCLRQVKINADPKKTKNVTRNRNYEEYHNIILSAATNFDIQFATKKLKRQVFTHHLIDHDDDYYACNDSYYDIDAPVSFAPVIKWHHDSDHDAKHVSTSVDNNADKENGEPPRAVLNPEGLVWSTFLWEPRQDDGQQFRAQTVNLINNHEENVSENPTNLKFFLFVNDDKAEEAITYNKLLVFLSNRMRTMTFCGSFAKARR